MIDFLLQAWALKDTVRTGWTLRGVENPESVADHSWGTALLCLVMGPRAGVDVQRCVCMSVVHDLAECITGDIPANTSRTVSVEEKARLEAGAMTRLLALGASSTDVHALWREYEEKNTPEALFVRDMNLIDMVLQAHIYELAERDRQPLDEFFVTTEKRLGTETGRELFAAIAARRG